MADRTTGIDPADVERVRELAEAARTASRHLALLSRAEKCETEAPQGIGNGCGRGVPPDQKAALDRQVQVESANLEQAPDNTEALYRLGLAFLSLGEPKKAIKPLEALVQKDAESLDGKLLLARAYRLSNDTTKAGELLDAAIV